MSAFLDELEEILGPVDNQDYAEARLALEIAVQFAALRERRGLTQRQLAERLGRSQQAVSKIENPTHGGHNLAKLKEAVAALDGTLDVTIVPLEDLEAYEALRPPKPALEDIRRRVAPDRTTADRRAAGRFHPKRTLLKSSDQTALGHDPRLTTSQLIRPSRTNKSFNSRPFV